ncbi:MAG: thermonuclease family protein [Candidatus Obscuribacterales bacterium]|nr:thermonuclease family protein [Candidatus Obscuribacterales bacterium]
MKLLQLALTFYLLVLTATSQVWALDFNGQVVGISDGDTITVLHDGRREKIRLSGVDCPEKSQPFGKQAKLYTADQCFGQQVTVRSQGRDKYGRTIGEIILPNGQSLNNELVRSGNAWWYRRYSQDSSLEQLESSAKQQQVGLWASSSIPPWEFRKQQKKH